MCTKKNDVHDSVEKRREFNERYFTEKIINEPAY